MNRVEFSKQNRIHYNKKFFNSQTVGEKVYSQEGNSPDQRLKSLSFLLSEKS